MSRKVAVVDYQAQWSEEFEHERALVEAALGENCITVHHIGSTSVPEPC